MLSMSKIGWCKEWVVQVGKELEKSSFWSPKAKRNKLTTRACTPRIPLIRPSWRSRSWLTSCQFLQGWCLQELTPSATKWQWKLEPMSAVKVERQSKYVLPLRFCRSDLPCGYAPDIVLLEIKPCGLGSRIRDVSTPKMYC